MFARTSGRSMFGLRIDPRSPPVQVTTWTSTPSATYLAVVAAPLLDSSSGCACTCISRRRDAAAEDSDDALDEVGGVDGMAPILGSGPRASLPSMGVAMDTASDLEQRYRGPSRVQRVLALLVIVALV